VTNEPTLEFDHAYYHFWAIDSRHGTSGLIQVVPGHSQIYIFDHVADVPLSAPVVAAAFVLIVLLLLFAGYCLIANLRHKDAPGDAKLD